MISRVPQQARFQHRLRELLNEQRHAVGARHDLLDHLGRQRLGAGQLLDHGRPLAPGEPAEQQ